MDGDVIEYSLLKQVYPPDQDPVFLKPYIQLLFPDLPARIEHICIVKEVALSDLLQGISLPSGRDLSRVQIRRMGKDKLEIIPLDLLAASSSLRDDESNVAKALEFLKTPILPRDIIVFPSKDNLS